MVVIEEKKGWHPNSSCKKKDNSNKISRKKKLRQEGTYQKKYLDFFKEIF